MTLRTESVTGFGRVAVRSRRLHCLVAVLMGLVSLPAGPAAAQQDTAVPSTGPLPTIVYPSPTAKPASLDIKPPAVAPKPNCAVDDDCQTQYVIVGGYWGYWDRHRHFHRVSAAAARGARPRAIAERAIPVSHSGGSGHDKVHR